jgi:ribose transport system permease protein
MNSNRLARFASGGGVVWIVVVVIALYAIVMSDAFRTSSNMTNLSRQMVVLGIASIAQFVVVLAGGVDLSIGANVRLAAIVAAIVMDGSDGRFVVGVLAAVAVSVLIGLVNGIVTVLVRVEPFIATLGTGAIVSGTALYLASTPTGRASRLWTDLYGRAIGPIPVFVLLAALVLGAVWFLLYRRPWGRHVYAVGGDATAARLSGVRSMRVALSVYVLAGALAGVAGLVVIGRTGVGDASAASGLEFETLAVVVIGGASLAGGRGRFVGVMGGVVLFGMLNNVFNLLKIEVWYQELVRGGVILVAAALYLQRRRDEHAVRPTTDTGGRPTPAPTTASGGAP